MKYLLAVFVAMVVGMVYDINFHPYPDDGSVFVGRAIFLGLAPVLMFIAYLSEKK